MSMTLQQASSRKTLAVCAKITYQNQILDLSDEKNAKALQNQNQERVYNFKEQSEINKVKSGETNIRKQRPQDTNSDEYANWQLEYNDAKEDATQAENDIKFKYEELKDWLERELNKVQSQIEEEITMLQSKLQYAESDYQSADESYEPEPLLGGGSGK